MADRILVPFEGEGSGAGELSWGQQEIWTAMRQQHSSLNNGAVTALTEGTSVEDVAAELRFIMGRHQSLRTRLRFRGDGRPEQVVAASGEIPLEIVEAGGADPAAAAAAVHDRYKEKDFDYSGEWPVRMAVVTRRGVPTHSVVMYCHISGDGFSVLPLRASLAQRASGGGPAKAPAAMDPLEQARWQHGPAGRRQSDMAMRHWRRLLRAAPAHRFRGSCDRRTPRHWQAQYSSAALLLAVRAICARTKADASQVLLTAFAVSLARVTGINPVLTQVVVSNRFRPGLADTVSPVNQTGLCLIDVAGVSFDQAVARTWQATVGAYKSAYYDPGQRAAVIAEVSRERGEDIDVSCFFNDRRLMTRHEVAGPAAAEDEVRAALPLSTMDWGYRTDRPNERFFLHVNDAPGRMAYEACFDTHFMSPADAEACVRAVEATAVQAAFDPAALAGGRLASCP
jgi:Condensation domain